jgi:hypothetical protein
VIGDNLKHRTSTKTFQRLRCRIGLTLLGGKERLADIAPNLLRKAAQIFSA